MKTIKSYAIIGLLAALVYSCGGTAPIISTPIAAVDNIPLKIQPLTEEEKENWGHLDLIQDTVPGMSVDKAYNEILKNRKGKDVIVAVLDSGIDIDHEDLKDQIWVNEDEIPNNGIDDDKNGFIDDVYGWNFLGDGYDEQLEFVRTLVKGDTSDPDYKKAEKEYQKEYEKYANYRANYTQILEQVTKADDIISAYLDSKEYTKADVDTIKSEDQELSRAVNILKYVYSLDMESAQAFKDEINNDLIQINDRLDYNLNKDFKGRKNGDDPDDYSKKIYGNNNVRPSEKGEKHGTHVAGIIAAVRNNGLGANGVANNVKIMSVRTVPNGDEYDKDVALAIRYAVDNGASIINTSFGKYYSPHSDWVRDAIAYAGKNDVLIVNAAGNETEDLDNKEVYPNDAVGVGPEVSNTFLSVGSIESSYGSKMVSTFSNFGKVNVDIFAPGGKIYSTVPFSEYEFLSGTSMAAPSTAGVAALIRSYFPKLSAAQVKKVIIDSGLPIKTKVMIGGDSGNVKPYAELSRSGKIVNAYNALIFASKAK